MRQKRKLEHLRCALEETPGAASSGLEDVFLVHQAVAGLGVGDIDAGYSFGGKKMSAPLVINAITGGDPELTEINRQLARAARKAGIAMAVGSQAAALEAPSLSETFTVVRRENPDGVIMANVGCLTPPDLAAQAVEMIGADALQVHLNIPQELAMREGERDFTGILEGICRIVRSTKVPVIAKEVGFGISRETAAQLHGVGVEWIDIGGHGGTNFVAIERMRGAEEFGPEMEEWGITTAVSLVETLSLELPIRCIATGGIRNPLEAAKCVALGADLVGVAGHFLRVLVKGSEAQLDNELERFVREFRSVMLMTDSRDLERFKMCSLVITGKTREWLEQRGVNLGRYARRNKKE
ncbi:MAG: type 2 isopentenyl-diphosphate Delta-isomerase [Firmicutes bacterium]|nr:type 2 isopentenyl-diphosphate Delta-isomerase [Bacillota bacterium]